MAVFDFIACNDLIPPRALFNWVVRTGNPGFDLATINDFVFDFCLRFLQLRLSVSLRGRAWVFLRISMPRLQNCLCFYTEASLYDRIKESI